MRSPDWHLLIAFEAVARHGSFSRAASELNVLQPAVSRRVAQLEAELNVTLLHRTRPSATLTDDGQILFRAVTGGLTQVQAAVDQIARSPGDRVLTVNTTIGFASCFLMRRLNAFHHACPDDVVELVSRDQNDGYRLDTCDIVTVFDAPNRLPGVDHRLIFKERMIAVCAPAYLSRHAVESDNLGSHRLLHLRAGIHDRDWHSFMGELGQGVPAVASSDRFTSFMVYLQAALNGDGIAIGWTHLLDDLLESGQLVKAVDHEVVSERGYFCCLTERGAGREGALRFVDWLSGLVEEPE